MRTTIQERRLGWLLGFLGLTFGAAALGGAFTARSVGTWYQTLRKPPWNPPDWLFGPVWTALYVMMAVAAWLICRAMPEQADRRGAGVTALAAWAVQLALNVSWSAVFFGQRQIAAGLAVIGLLWAAIAATATLATRVARPAGLLLLPYLAWTTFAAVLNYRVWQLNRER